MNFHFQTWTCQLTLLLDMLCSRLWMVFSYNQIRISLKDAAKTTFWTPIGNFYYTIMPFGLENAGATYQRVMTTIFHDMMHKEIEDYVDDIVIKSKVRENHFYDLGRVFERCRLYKLRMNPLKCAFGVSTRKFLGFLVHQ